MFASLTWMLQASVRLLRLLTLLQSQRSWTGAELSERLEMTPRTLRRDVDKLRSLGYPILSSSGVAGGYHMGAGTRLPPLVFADREALAVALGLRLAAATTVRGLEQPALDALLKLERLLPARLRAQLASFRGVVTWTTPSAPSVSVDVLMSLAQACSERERITFRYRAVHGEGLRRVEPCGVVHVGQRWYFVAFDLERDDFRTFRVDRIVSTVENTGERAAPHPVPGGDLAAFVSRGVGSAAYPIQGRVVLHAPLAELAARLSPLTGMLSRRDEASCEWLTGGNSLRGVAWYLAQLDCDFEVIEPPELLDEIRALCHRWSRAVQGSAAVQGGVGAPPREPRATKS